MASIDERVVSMSFDNAKFEAGVAKTMATLTKLNQSLASIGSTNGLAGIQKAANNIDLSGITSSLNKLKISLAEVGGTTPFSKIEGDANKVNFGPFTGAIESIKGRLSSLTDAPSAALDKFKEKLGFKGADAGLNNIEAASNKVKFAGASTAATDLQKKLAFPGIDGRFGDIEKASGKVHLSGITNAISEVSKGFSILQGAAAVALGNISTKAITAGGSLLKSFSFGPITAGLQEYTTNLNSIQTILANTKFQGSTLKDVNAALLQLNKYSDQTIYNFSQMAKNIGTFTAAGVDLDKSVSSIKGIANLAALSGSSAEQASSAMYQLSQAIASGRVSLQDWNSVVNAGMGGATFQRALATTAEVMGTVAEGAVKIDKATGKATINGESFRESITAKPGEESWLTSEVLTNTLSQFTGDLSKAELAAQGFNEEQIKAIMETAKTAKLAATEVKTLSGVFDVVKESIGSGWSQTFQLIFGDFEEAKSLFTGVTSAITGFVSENANARNKVLADWKELGGRTTLIEGIKDAFIGLGSILKPIKDAFREIFPKKTGQDLFELTQRFADFTEKLKIGPETANNLKHTFAGFFAVLDIGKTIVGEVLGVFGDLLGAATSGSGGMLKFTGTVGDFLVSVDKAITEGEGLSNFFDGLGKVLSAPIKLLSDLAGALGSLFEGGGDSSGMSSSIDDLENSLNPLTIALNAVSGAWDGFLKMLGKVTEALKPAVKEIGSAFGSIGSALADALVNADFEKFFDVIQTALIGGIFVAIKKGFSKGINIDFGGGVLDNLSKTFTSLTGSLKAMQHNIQADTLLKIGLAIVTLAGGVKLLSTIDPKRLTSAMTAVSVGLGELVAAMALLTKVGGFTSFLTLPFIAGSLILLAAAVDTLAIAVFAFSKLSWEELIKGLTGVGGALVAIAAGIKLIPPSVVLIGPALLPVAVALNILALAVKIFSTMDWEELAKGLIGVAGGLTAIGIGTKFIGPSILLIGPGLIGVAVALNILAGAVKLFGMMDMKTMAKGIGGIAASLVLIGLAIRTIPPTVALQAAGLVVLSIALTGMAGAIALMGSMNIKTIAKGLAAIGASLVVLSIGLRGMTTAIPGALALMVAATALAVLAPVLGILGTMKWTTIVKGLAAMSLVLGVLAAGGALAAPAITALGLALITLGTATLLAGTGVYLLASGLAKLGGDGSKGIAAVMVAMTAFLALLPKMIIDFLKGLVEVTAAIAALAPKVVDSMVKIINALLDVVIKASPKMAEAAIALITAFLKVLDESSPKLIASGFALLIALLKGINDNIGEVIKQVGEIIVKFLTAILSHIPAIVIAGANVLIKFLEGLASKIPEMIGAAAEALAKFLTGIAQNLPKIVSAGVNLVVEFLDGIAKNIGKVITAGANLVIKILEGIGENAKKVAAKGADLMGDFVEAAAKAILGLTNRVAQIMINFLNELAAAIRKYSPELGKAGGNVASAIMEGILGGISGFAGQVVGKLKDMAGDAIGAVKGVFKSHSPSKVFQEIGQGLMEGLVIGIDDDSPGVIRILRSASEDMVDTMVDSLTPVPSLLEGLMDMDPVITPVLDLSSVQKSAQELAALTNVIPITAAASYNQAASISAEQEAAQTSTIDDTAAPPPAEVKFEQNNYSPESLSTAEIYRQTRNQLSQAKKALGVP